MKLAFVLLVFSSVTSHASTIYLNPGESVTVSGTQVVCSGTGSGGQYTSIVDRRCLKRMEDGASSPPSVGTALAWAKSCRNMDPFQSACFIVNKTDNEQCVYDLKSFVSGFPSTEEENQMYEACKTITVNCRF